MDKPCFKYQVYNDASKYWSIGYLGADSLEDAEAELYETFKTEKIKVIRDPQYNTYQDWITYVNSRKYD